MPDDFNPNIPPDAAKCCPECGYNPDEADEDEKITAGLVAALRDARSGMQYIRERYGDLYGVGFDRVEENARAALAKATGDGDA